MITWRVKMRDKGWMTHQILDTVAEELVAENGAELVGHVGLHEVPSVVARLYRHLAEELRLN